MKTRTSVEPCQTLSAGHRVAMEVEDSQRGQGRPELSPRQPLNLRPGGKWAGLPNYEACRTGKYNVHLQWKTE